MTVRVPVEPPTAIGTNFTRMVQLPPDATWVPTTGGVAPASLSTQVPPGSMPKFNAPAVMEKLSGPEATLLVVFEIV